MADTAQSLALFESIKSAMDHIRRIRSHLVVDGLEKDYWNEERSQLLYRGVIADILNKVHAIENSTQQRGVASCL
jgi:hypothetical protein